MSATAIAESVKVYLKRSLMSHFELYIKKALISKEK